MGVENRLVGQVKKVQNNMRIKAGQILVIKTPPDEIGKILDIFEGTQQIQQLIVARQVLGKSSTQLK